MEKLKAGAVIVISKWKAKEIAEDAGLTRPHFALEVIRVERETERAVQLTVKLSAQRTSHCGVCGILLTNPESVTNGIGPICAEKSGVSYSGKSLDELSAALQETKPVTTWLPKSAIKKVFEVPDPLFFTKVFSSVADKIRVNDATLVEASRKIIERRGA